MNYEQKIINYYDRSQWLYRFFCNTKGSLGMHFGLWGKNVKNREEAMIYQDLVTAKLGKIKKGDLVLDAGCGIGGSAITLAKKTGAKVTGITLSQNQVSIAVKESKRFGVQNLTNFLAQNYEKTNFPDNYFDVVFGNESICYSTPKTKFLKEAFRILKPGGRLVITDGYTTRKKMSENEIRIINDFNKNFALKELVNYEDMTKMIKGSGFANVNVKNSTKMAWPSVMYFGNFMKKMWPLIYLISLVPSDYTKAAKQNAISLIKAYEGVAAGIIGHYIHSAQKPNI